MKHAQLQGSTHRPHTPQTTHVRTHTCARRRVNVTCEAASPVTSVRVCTSKTCRRDGSPQILKFMQDLTQGSEVSVQDCSCLGNCGSGPNMVLRPSGKMLDHVATVEDAIEVLTKACGISVSDDVLRSLELKMAGNTAAVAGRLDEAVEKYSAGIALNPSTGMHLLLCNRSSVRLQQGLIAEALADAQQCVELAPPTFINGWVRLIDCLYANKQFQEAAQTLVTATSKCPQIRTTPEYKMCSQALRKEGFNV